MSRPSYDSSKTFNKSSSCNRPQSWRTESLVWKVKPTWITVTLSEFTYWWSKKQLDFFNTLIIYVSKPLLVILIYTSNKRFLQCVNYHIPHSESRNTNKGGKELQRNHWWFRDLKLRFVLIKMRTRILACLTKLQRCSLWRKGLEN